LICVAKNKSPGGAEYLSRVVDTYSAARQSGMKSLKVAGANGDFQIETELQTTGERQYRRAIDRRGPATMTCELSQHSVRPAESSHYYTEAHPFYDRNVAIIGAGIQRADHGAGTLFAAARA